MKKVLFQINLKKDIIVDSNEIKFGIMLILEKVWEMDITKLVVNIVDINGCVKDFKYLNAIQHENV